MAWAVIERPYSMGFATVGALYERPRYNGLSVMEVEVD
jgi:hypothetical protein